MNKVVSSILFALLVGSVAAFFRPAQPFQVVEQQGVPTQPEFFPRGGGGDGDALDNPDIAEDRNITPARKCGFCMGVSKVGQ